MLQVKFWKCAFTERRKRLSDIHELTIGGSTYYSQAARSMPKKWRGRIDVGTAHSARCWAIAANQPPQGPGLPLLHILENKDYVSLLPWVFESQHTEPTKPLIAGQVNNTNCQPKIIFVSHTNIINCFQKLIHYFKCWKYKECVIYS